MVRGVCLTIFVGVLAALLQQAAYSQDIANDRTSTNQDRSDEATAVKATRPGEGGGIPTSPSEIIQILNWRVAPFIFASIIAVWFAIERLVLLRRGRVIPKAFAMRFLEHLEDDKLDQENALKLCNQSGSPLAEVFAHGIRKWGKPSVEVEQAIIDGGERQVSQLRKHLRVLNGVATVTPLLGLLGTVIGMIEAFNNIAAAGAMGKAEQLASGIALALLTTAFGLTIAIPSLIMYMYLAGRVDALVMEMDELAQEVVRLVSAETLAAKSETPANPTPSGKARAPGDAKAG